MEITLRDVYDQQLRTAEQVAQMRGDLNTLSARVDERLASGQRKLDDHEDRLRIVEAAREQGRGKASMLTVLLSVGGSSTVAAVISYLLASH